jgi:hypothetical protein
MKAKGEVYEIYENNFNAVLSVSFGRKVIISNVCISYAFGVKCCSSGMHLLCCGMAILNERADMWQFSTERLTFSVPLDFCALYLLYKAGSAFALP